MSAKAALPAPIRLLNSDMSRSIADVQTHQYHHGISLQGCQIFQRENDLWDIDTEAERGNRSFHFCICVLTSRLREKLSLIPLASSRNSTVLYCAALCSRGSASLVPHCHMPSVEWLDTVPTMFKLDLVATVHAATIIIAGNFCEQQIFVIRCLFAKISVNNLPPGVASYVALSLLPSCTSTAILQGTLIDHRHAASQLQRSVGQQVAAYRVHSTSLHTELRGP